MFPPYNFSSAFSIRIRERNQIYTKPTRLLSLRNPILCISSHIINYSFCNRNRNGPTAKASNHALCIA